MDESRLSSHDAVYVCAMLKISECCAILTFRALHIGQMSERSKETVLKTVEGQPSASSNLALSAFGLIGFFSKPLFFLKVIDCMCWKHCAVGVVSWKSHKRSKDYENNRNNDFIMLQFS